MQFSVSDYIGGSALPPLGRELPLDLFGMDGRLGCDGGQRD